MYRGWRRLLILYGNSNDCKSAFKQRLCQIPINCQPALPVSLFFSSSLWGLSHRNVSIPKHSKKDEVAGVSVHVCLFACLRAYFCVESTKMKKILCFFTWICIQSLSCSACVCVSVCECARMLVLIRSRFHHWLLKTAAGSVHCSTLFTVYSHRLSFCPLSFALIADNLFQ